MTTTNSPQNATGLLREQVKVAHDVLEATMADVTAAQLHTIPPGIANPLGATYAHLVCSEDLTIQGMLRQVAPLGASTWAERTGLSEPMPMPGPHWGEYPAWTRRVQIDLPALRAYAQAVYEATDAYLAAMPDEALIQQLDLTSVGLGTMPLSTALTMLLLNHIGTETGEVAVLKGIQGARGYPF